MPVRIIFRGLVLFKVTEGVNGRIVAKLVDVGAGTPPPSGTHSMSGMSHASQPGDGGAGGGHSPLHRHESDLQVYSRKADGTDLHEIGRLTRQANGQGNIDITFPDLTSPSVKRSQSYDEYCPRLSAIMNGRTDVPFPSEAPRHSDTSRMNAFAPNTITVHGGTIRVREVVTWDGGAFPLPSGRSAGVQIEAPAEVKFVGSSVHGFMASECIIDVPNADNVHIDGRIANLPRTTRKGDGEGEGMGKPSLSLPPRTVECLVTNFPPQRPKALFWSGHFSGLLEAAGYLPISLPSDEFNEFAALATEYDRDAFVEDEPLLNRGFPFPYIEKVGRDIRLAAVNPVPVPPSHVGDDPWNRPLCPQGDE